jgi:hypothetical protein
MATPMPKQSVVRCSPAVLASVNGERTVAKTVAILHVLAKQDAPNINPEMDSYITSGLASLAFEVSEELVQAFNQLDAAATAGRKL